MILVVGLSTHESIALHLKLIERSELLYLLASSFPLPFFPLFWGRGGCGHALTIH